MSGWAIGPLPGMEARVTVCWVKPLCTDILGRNASALSQRVCGYFINVIINHAGIPIIYTWVTTQIICKTEHLGDTAMLIGVTELIVNGGTNTTSRIHDGYYPQLKLSGDDVEYAFFNTVGRQGQG